MILGMTQIKSDVYDVLLDVVTVNDLKLVVIEYGEEGTVWGTRVTDQFLFDGIDVDEYEELLSFNLKEYARQVLLMQAAYELGLDGALFCAV